MAPPLIPNAIQARQGSTPPSLPPASATIPPQKTEKPKPADSSDIPLTTGGTGRPSPTGPPRGFMTSRSESASPAATETAVPTNSSNNPLNMSPTQSSIVIAIVVAIGVVLAGFIGYVILKALRVRYKDPKYLPGSWLKKKWTNWDVMGYNSANPGQATLNRQARSRANIAANRALDRQASVRSVITLPPYREMAEMDLETTIGREGERDGLDTIVVFPESGQEEEARREDRMQAMYELRLQRRAQRAARESRESRNNSTTTMEAPNSTQVSLTGLDMETGGSGRSTGELTAAILNERRRLSEVSYNAVGYSRPDGSRIRSTSTNSNPGNQASDSQPLLSETASGESRRSRSNSMLSLNTNVSGRDSTERRDSTEILTGGDIGQTRLPPSYDGLEWGDAPPYMSPISPVSRSNTEASTRGRQPGLNVPLVRVIDASNPNSPMSPNRRDGPL